MDKIKFSKFAIYGSSDSGDPRFLARDPMYGNWYWTDSLNQAKSFDSIKEAEDVLRGPDFQHTRELIEVDSNRRIIHPPIAIDGMLKLSKINPENSGSITILELKFTAVKSYSVKASIPCKETEKFLKLK